MNRRQFTQRLAALATTPAIPTGLATAATPAPVAAASVGQPYMWAAFIARVHDKASVQMFKRQLSLTDETAAQVYNSLLHDGIISAPNAHGISNAMNPFKRNFSTSLASSPQSSFVRKVEESVDQLLNDDEMVAQQKADDDSEPVNPDSPDCVYESDIRENPAPNDPADSS